MNQTALALIVGLLAGLVGGYAGHLLGGDASAPSDDTVVTDGTVDERLDRIETMLAELSNQPLTLEGRAQPSGGSTRTVNVEFDDEVFAAFEERMKSVVQDSVRETVESIREEDGGIELIEPEKKNVTLAEFAAEVGLTADEEEALRDVHKQTADEIMALLVEEGETVDDVRRQLDEAKDDPAARGKLMTKFMGGVMKNIGGFIGVMMSHEGRVQQAIGSEKAARLDNEFELTDVDSYGIAEIFEGFGD